MGSLANALFTPVQQRVLAEWKRKLAEGKAFATKIQAQPKIPLIGWVDDLA